MADLYTDTVRPKKVFGRPGTLFWAARFRLRVMEEGLGEEFRLPQAGCTLPSATRLATTGQNRTPRCVVDPAF